METVSYLGEESLILLSVPPMVARQLVGAIGYKSHLCGSDLQNQTDKLGRGITLDIELSPQTGT